MSVSHAIRALTTALMIGLGAAGLSGCADDGNKEPIETLAPDMVRLTGSVSEIDDDVPADGGVTIRMTDKVKGAVTLNFESLFTLPRPTEARQALYADIQKVSAGDVVTATARLVEGNYRLESIRVIEDH
ncbi:MAG TPA: hypothetical protein VF720_04315 [Candidatus Eisenbacteria bacterium]